MAKALARHIGYAYIDTGAMYRAVTLYCLENGLVNADGTIDETQLIGRLGEIKITFGVNAETGQSETYLDGRCVEREIRDMRVSAVVSQVAKIPAVRRALVAQQQAMGQEKGIVMDGRDIGTVVFPEAEMKVYVTASAETRARRRYDELVAKGDATVTYEEVLHNVTERDRIDTTRTESPLRKADDALLLDNSHLTIAQQKDWLLAQYQRALASMPACPCQSASNVSPVS